MTFLKSLTHTVAASAISLALIGCSGGTNESSPAAQSPIPAPIQMTNLGDTTGLVKTRASEPNYLYMIGDDIGVEALTCYNIGQSTAVTPNLDKMCNEGLRFDNFYVQPACSPTRATLMTGQYGFANGVGVPIPPLENIEWNVPESAGPDLEPAAQGMGAGGEGGGMGDMGEGGGMGEGGMGDMGAGGMGDMAEGGGMGDMGAGGMGDMAEGGGMGDMAEGGMGDMGAGGMGDMAAPQEAAAPVSATAVAETITPGLSPDAYTFAHALKADTSKGYRVGAIGKWHLADDKNGGLEHPIHAGFDTHLGPVRGGGVVNYRAWSKSIDGAPPFGIEGYVTTDTVNDAIRWMAEGPTDKPWFLWLAFNAPHTPFHVPPTNLVNSDLKNLDPDTATDHEKYNAMMEAMDTEIGRLLGSLDAETLANTYVSFLGDNGTPGQVATAPFDGQGRAKGAIYRGGINVPFFLTGPNVPTGVTPALANGVDLFATVMDISGIAPDANAPERPFHSVSLAPIFHGETDQVRDYAFSDWFGPRRDVIVGLQTIRNLDYKLVADTVANTQELYHLKSDPNEEIDLTEGTLSAEAKANMASLNVQLAELLATQE